MVWTLSNEVPMVLESSKAMCYGPKRSVNPSGQLHIFSFQRDLLKMKFAKRSGTIKAKRCFVHIPCCCRNSFRRPQNVHRSKIDFSVLKGAQTALQRFIGQALQLYLCCKNLQRQLLQVDVPKQSATNNWPQNFPLLDQNVRRKAFLFLIGSVMAAMLIMTTVPSSYSSSLTWALTEENLIFLEAWRTVDRAYIDKSFNGQSWFRYREEALRREPMKNREETYMAIRKMLATLEDPFTRFLEPEKFKSLRTGTRGAVTGVGLEVGYSDGLDANLVVIAPVVGGPAERAGVLPGDVISRIDGTPTKGMGLYDAAQRLQGPENSQVTLTLHSKKSNSMKTLSLVRETIKINPVTWCLCGVVDEGQDPLKIGYIRLATFNENASRSVREAVHSLKEGGATAYILDVRNNSGGLFPAGIEIAKMWLEKGVITYIADSMGIRDIYETDGNGAIAANEPLAVLVNKGTASASEILAGALKDNKRAIIFGEPTFGKGKIQSVFELSDGSGMAVTVARYETPNNVDIDKVGITPNQPLPSFLPLEQDKFCKCLVDSSLPCHMSPSTFFSR